MITAQDISPNPAHLITAVCDHPVPTWFDNLLDWDPIIVTLDQDSPTLLNLYTG